ncbi:MAG: LysE family transporter [Chloroflexales bacterium]|nr:LysE family transporter [Chloroflexales bacterium]
MFTESLRRGATRGFRCAFLFLLGALGGDLVWAALALSGAAAIAQHAIARLLLSTCGGALLLALAFQAVRHAARPPDRTITPPAARGDLLAGLTLSVANPLAITFWLSVGGGMFMDRHPTVVHVFVGAGGFLLAVLLCDILLAGTAAWGAQFLTPRRMRWCNLLVAAMLAVSGVAMLGHLLTHVLVR